MHSPATALPIDQVLGLFKLNVYRSLKILNFTFVYYCVDFLSFIKVIGNNISSSRYRGNVWQLLFDIFHHVALKYTKSFCLYENFSVIKTSHVC